MKKIAFSLVALLTFTGCQRQDLSDSWVEDTKIEKMEEQNTKAVFADTDLLGFLAYSGVDTKISPQRDSNPKNIRGVERPRHTYKRSFGG